MSTDLGATCNVHCSLTSSHGLLQKAHFDLHFLPNRPRWLKRNIYLPSLKQSVWPPHVSLIFLHVKEPLVWEVRRGGGINSNFQWDHPASCLSFQSSPPRFFSTSTVAKPPFNSKREQQQKWGRIIPRRPWRHQRGKG